MAKAVARAAFPPRVLSAIREGKILGIRAGSAPHRVIGIWAVVVEGRVFVRSWSRKPSSWWRTFLEDPRGVIVVEGRTIPVRAVQTRSERLKDAVSRAYLEKYDTPGALRYARDLGRAPSRATTTELVPADLTAAAPKASRPRRPRTGSPRPRGARRRPSRERASARG